jgi:uncharacterized membrane protein YdjX (TVP38/TMEM64 family)
MKVKLKRKKLLAFANIAFLISLGIWTFSNYQAGGIVFTMFEGDGEGFIESFKNLDSLTRVLAVIFLIIIEVIIGVIPGPLVYSFIGLMVGPLLGSTLIIVGNVIGSIVNFYQGKLIWSGLHDDGKKHQGFLKKFQEEGARGLFLLRLNPMTSYDFLPYIAGGSGMKFGPFFIANTLGLLPLIIIFTYFGSEILEKHTWSLYLLLAFTVGYFLYSYLRNRVNNKRSS